MEVIQILVSSGNTVIMIEHNLDIIRTADWIIDLGPEGGDGGGKIVAQGTVAKLCAQPKSFTGQFLKQSIVREQS